MLNELLINKGKNFRNEAAILFCNIKIEIIKKKKLILN